MTGIDKIIAEIGNEASETARAIIEEAQNSAREDKRMALGKAAEQCAQIRRQSEKAVADSLDRATAAAALAKRKKILSAKQELIREIIQAAHHRLLKLSDQEYFAMLLKMIRKYALAQNGELLLSPADYLRRPTDFQESVNTILQESKGTLNVSDLKRPIDGGFILIYGEIEENCSFSALFAAAKDQLQDKVHERLFL